MRARPGSRRRWSKSFQKRRTSLDSQWCLFSWKSLISVLLFNLSFSCTDMTTDFVNALDLQGYQATDVFLKAFNAMAGKDGSHDLQEVYHNFPASIQQGILEDLNWENCYSDSRNFFAWVPNKNCSDIQTIQNKKFPLEKNLTEIIDQLMIDLNGTEIKKDNFSLSKLNNSRVNDLPYFISLNDINCKDLRYLDWNCLGQVEFHPIWGRFSMSLLFVPGVIGFIFASIQYIENKRKWRPKKEKKKLCNFFLAFLTLFCFPAALIVVQILSICSPYYKIMAVGFLGLEAFVESGAQLVLQLVIMMYLKKATKWQLATICFSIFTMSKTAILYDMLFLRVEHAPAMKPAQMIGRIFSVLPMYATSLVFKTGSLVLICTYFRYLALFPLALYWCLLLVVALCLKFGVSKSILLASTNVTIMGLGPFRSNRKADSRFRYMLITSILSFILLGLIIGALMYFVNHHPTFLAHWDQLYFHGHPSSFNYTCGIIMYTGFMNTMLLITSRYGNIASDMDEDDLWIKFKETFLAGNNNEKFLKASCNGHAEKMEVYIKIMGNTLDMNYIPFVVDDIPRKTPLTGAIEGGHMEAVDVLLKQPQVDLNKENGLKERPLSVALRKKRYEIIRVLLEQPSLNINYNYFYNQDYYTPLIFVVSIDDLDSVKMILDSPIIDVNQEDKDGQTPLGAALSALFLAQVNDFEDGEGTLTLNEPLNLQSFMKRASTIKKRISQGKNPRLSIKKKKILTKQQTTVQQTAILKLLISHPNININVEVSMDGIRHTVLTSVIMSKDVDMTFTSKVLDVPGICINHTKGIKYSPLTAAITMSDETTIKKLLNMEGIQVNEIDQELNTPLTLAISEDDKAIINLLMTFPFIDVNYRKGALLSPLTAAVISNDVDTLQWLLCSQEIEVNKIDGQGKTPLIYAVNTDNIPITKILLNDHNIDINCTDNCKETALYKAAQNGNEKIVKMLVQVSGIDLDIKCGQEKKTAEENAERWGYGNLVTIIREAREGRFVPSMNRKETTFSV